jgi:hypothetical protein
MDRRMKRGWEETSRNNPVVTDNRARKVPREEGFSKKRKIDK